MPLAELTAAITSMHAAAVKSGGPVPESFLSVEARVKHAVHELKFINAIAYRRPDLWSIGVVGTDLLRDVAVDVIPATVTEMYAARKEVVRVTLAEASAQRAERRSNQPSSPGAPPAPPAAERPSILSAGQPKPSKSREWDGGIFAYGPDDLGDFLGDLLEGVFDGF